MASDLNRTILVGRLVRDPDLKYTQSGTSIANFSIANNKTYTQGGEKKDTTSFFNCVAWGKLGEVIVQYCKKGHRIGIEGRLQQRSWEDQNGNKRSTVEVVTENIQFLESQSGNAAPQNEKSTGQEGRLFDNQEPITDWPEDDIPF